jgi:hypothetical protein
MRPRVLRIVQCMMDFVRRTKLDLYQTRSPPFGRLKVSKGDAGGVAGRMASDGGIRITLKTWYSFGKD